MERAGRHREAFRQLVRYAVNGAIVTAFYTVVFVALDSLTRAPLQLCNLIGYAASVAFGYTLHSRVTFRGHGARGRGSRIRFVAASLPSLALNAFWAWLFGTHLHWPHWTVQVPVWGVTPFMIFAINRWWVFR